MIENQILCLGLSRVELQTLYCRFPLLHQFYQVQPDDFDDPEKLSVMIGTSLCLFLNPKKLTPEQLIILTREHRYAKEEGHAAIMLFTSAFTKEQRQAVNTKELFRVDLKARFDRTLRDTVDVIRKATMPCWNGLKRMESNMFNDGWYLVDFDASGTDPLNDEMISLSIAYMANYEIKETHLFYIKPEDPISDKIERITGITNEMLENGITKAEAVEFLNTLGYNAPIVLETEKYYLPFLQALYRSCDQKFDLPYIALDGLFSIAFGYLIPKRGKDVLEKNAFRNYPRSPVTDPYIAELYDLTLMVFENLQSRYDVRSPGQFHSLYFGEILCCD